MKNAIIGYTGFVGQNLDQSRYDVFINSKNIKEYKDAEFNLLVISAGDARKWYANENPSNDLIHILNLYQDIKNMTAKKVVLISTIDVYPDFLPELTYDENSQMFSDLPYGMHRLMLERLINMTFKDVSIIRLPGLIGNGLKKNIIYDICNNRKDQLSKYNPKSTYQYFDLKELDSILDIIINSEKIELLNLVSEPIAVYQIADALNLSHDLFSTSNKIVRYNIKTIHKKLEYFYDSKSILNSIRSYFENYK